MPALSAMAVRLALVHLGLGLTFGFLMLANKGVPFSTGMWRLLPAHIELLLVGWTVQLALGVAHWIIPRFSGGAFGRLWLAKLSLALLNLGVFLVVTSAIVAGPSSTTLVGRLLEVSSLLTFAIYIWPRVRPLGR